GVSPQYSAPGEEADRTRRAQRPGPVLLPRRAGGCCGCKRHDRLKLARRLPDPLERLDERHRRSRRRGAACSPPQRELRREPGRDPLDARAGQGGHATTQAPPLTPLRGLSNGSGRMSAYAHRRAAKLSTSGRRSSIRTCGREVIASSSCVRGAVTSICSWHGSAPAASPSRGWRSHTSWARRTSVTARLTISTPNARRPRRPPRLFCLCADLPQFVKANFFSEVILTARWEGAVRSTP